MYAQHFCVNQIVSYLGVRAASVVRRNRIRIPKHTHNIYYVNNEFPEKQRIGWHMFWRGGVAKRNIMYVEPNAYTSMWVVCCARADAPHADPQPMGSRLAPRCAEYP